MRLKDSKVDLDTPSGKMRTYIYEPLTDDVPVYQEKKYPGLIFFTAIFQFTPGIDRMARILASEGNLTIFFHFLGFIVFIPEIYHMHLPPGTTLQADPEGTAKG